MTPEVESAFISAIGSILSTFIGATTAALIGKRILKQERLQKDLQTAISDIEFLLMVEREHCDENKRQQRRSNFQTIRNRIRAQYSWSGRGSLLVELVAFESQENPEQAAKFRD
jgi:hypothetical protein